jgi:cytochrome P450
MTMMSDTDHARLRRALSPAFSSRALLEQEPILQANIDLLMKQLQARAEQGLSSDIRAWYNYTTFDVIGDLAFGESFGCLVASSFHEWVQMVLDHFYMSTLLHLVHRFSPLHKILAQFLPASLMEKRKRHSDMALEKVHRRTKQTSIERKDFIGHLIKAVEEGTISSSELDNQATILILAGSETTSVALTFSTYFLMTHRDVMGKLQQELKQNFRSESDIDMLSVNRLKYLQAVLQETLRCSPPITNGFPRQTPRDGSVVDGHFFPNGVRLIYDRIPIH